MNNSYAHTIRVSDFSLDDINVLYKILNTGYLLSRNNLIKEGITIPNKVINEDTSVFNGMDYISLCDMMAEHEFNSSYNMYIRNGLSLLFNHDIKVILPTLIDGYGRNIDHLYNMHNLGMQKTRYTDLSDEVQVKDKLSLDTLIGFCLPKKKIIQERNFEYYMAYLEMANEVIREYYPDLPIYNLDDGKVLSKNLRF